MPCVERFSASWSQPSPALAALSASGSLVHVRERPARTAIEREWPEWANPQVRAAIEGTGVSRLWSHQRQVADLVHSGRHTVVSTGTASGKSLAYLLPVLSTLADGASAPTGRGATALYLAPTKALSADQDQRIAQWAIPGLRAAVLDGDTPPEERRWIRDHAQLVLSNPDLVHHTLLPQHQRWAPFWRALRHVVVDECHIYRGVFGAHVAAVLRRLRRIAAHYRSEPTFVLASATVADPGPFASALTGLPVHAVVEDGSPRPASTFALWRPGSRAPSAGGSSAGANAVGADESCDERAQEATRRSAVSEAADLTSSLVRAGVQTLTFARSRPGVEAVAERVRGATGYTGDEVAAYRGGYLPEERRELESGLRSGRLRALAATNALELGIDISGIDAVVIAGWPGTVASLHQQAGRAGRAGTPALAVFVGADDPLDNFLLQHPESLLDRPLETIVLDPTNPHVLAPHLAAAAAELPLTEDDIRWFGEQVPALAEALTARGVLRRRPRGWFWARPEPAGSHVSLRGDGSPVVRIVQQGSGDVLGTVDAPRSHSATHPGAVYVHQGRTFMVTDLDLENGSAHVVRGDPGWTTVARSVSTFDIIDTLNEQSWGAATLGFGTLEVGTQVTSFLRRLPSGEVVGQHPLDLPEQRLRTRGVWWTLPPELLQEHLEADRIAGALHAAEHCSIGMLPLVVQADRWDIGGVSTVLHPDTGVPTVVVYDGHPGGAGFAERGFDRARLWLSSTLETIRACPCRGGCPSCVQSPKCGNGNEPLDKDGAAVVLELLLTAAPGPEHESTRVPEHRSARVAVPAQ